jgi:hypothetical protein
VPPVINNIVPAAGTPLASNTPVSFDVTSVAGLLRVFVTATYPGVGTTELVHDGTNFTEQYRATSARTAIAGGFHYSVCRNPVWPDAPTVTVYAEDVAGGETVLATSWTLALPPPLPDPGSLIPVFPTAGPSSAAPVVQHAQAYFLGVFDRIMDANWIAPLKTGAGSGYEMLQAYAAVGARISSAVSRLEQGAIIMFATGGALATGTVEFLRPSAAAGAVIVKAGTVITTSKGGRDFVTTQDAVFGALDLGPIAATVQAVAPGWQWNVRGRVVTSRGETLAGEIDTIRHFVQTAPAAPTVPTFIDPTIIVQQIVDTQGGADPMLDGLGEDRGVIRHVGELDPAYALRIRTLPDTVSPDAIVRAMTAFFAPYGMQVAFEELWDVRYQTCFDAPSPNAGSPTYLPQIDPGSPHYDPNWNPNYDPNLFTYDDPRLAWDPNDPTRPANALPYFNRWLDELEARGAFVVAVPNFPTLEDWGMVFDDTATTQTDQEVVVGTMLGHRGTAAYDMPSDITGVFHGFYDGVDVQKNAIYAAFWQLIQDISAGGVGALIELQGQ